MEGKNWINKLDELDGDTPPPRPKKSMGGLDFEKIKNSMPLDFESLNENKPFVALAAVVALTLILVVVLLFRTGGDTATADVGDVYTRLERLEAQLAKFENREEERQRTFVQFMQSEQEARARLDSQREGLDDLRQKIAALEKAGQRPAAAPAAAPVAAPAPQRQEQPAETRPAATASADKIVHEVQRGENLYRIGLQYNISVNELLRLNNLSANDSIHPGQELVVGTRNN